MLLVEFQSRDLAEHLACDEVLLDAAASGELGETLRTFEVGPPAVVLGVGSRCRGEVRMDRCRARGVRVLRRHSGGAAVVLGAGCLVYSLVLDLRKRPHLRSVRGSYAWILSRIARALSGAGVEVGHAGVSDLVWRGSKVGGSSQRRVGGFLLHHGTLLYDLDAGILDELLRRPPRQPSYRDGRNHGQFVVNLPLRREELTNALREAFGTGHARARLPDGLAPRLQELVAAKYASDRWNLRR